MFRLVESIRLHDGTLHNLEFHNERMMKTQFELFGLKKDINLAKTIHVPDYAIKGVYKCRVEYDKEVKKMEFIPYIPKSVKSLKIVEDNNISYSYKYTDRSSIQKLLEKKNDCDDILIIKNGFITDTSSANVILRDIHGVWYTPSAYLLPGTRRASLLCQGKIKETKIHLDDLKNYIELKLINAMLGMEDTEGIPVDNII